MLICGINVGGSHATSFSQLPFLVGFGPQGFHLHYTFLGYIPNCCLFVKGSGRMQEKSMPASNTGIMRATHLLQLPQEMLTEIIMYLPPAEKSRVRATCSFFKDLVDQPVVWQKSTIVLQRISAFNAEFWDVLQKRKITSVEVKEIRLKQWQKLLRFMPGLLDVTVVSLWSEEILQGLQLLTDLQKLHLKTSSRLSERNVISEVVHFQRLTHLLLCGITFLSGSELIKIACLQNLHMLSLHTVQKALPEKALEYVLFHLPKLRELSLSCILSKEHFLLCLSLPDKHPISYSSEGISSLDMFVDNIPSSLVKLSVIGTKLSNSALSCLSDKSWKLKEMDLTLSYGFDEKTLKQFPHLFPLLTRLCLSGFVLTDNILLSLAKMESLRELDVTGGTNLTKEAIQNFHLTTDCRVHLLVERHSVSSKCDCLWRT
ncbi:uncharacterized protein LOC127051821 isoform X4 [Gopherus flavomarginatus]|uniref:uncharacterized protein LOC127051821 isoform X4 n=1 Tax=Gopherus flavomarginatus TaxID=286002 RepID=UPI0021CBF763|nr:uncharacterized protein LOC127051821 isoform X4 [Gopherus flavomarginatus]